MEIHPTHIKDVFVIHPNIFTDSRGYFFESFSQKKFNELVGKEINFVQDNESKSTYGVLRGLHFQKAPYSQSKLVRVVKGAVWDVAVDIRRGSPTFGQYAAVELNEDNKQQLFIPRGFAHGYVVLSEEAIVQYKCDNYYHPASEGSVRFNDPDLNIDWKIPIKDVILSDKDKNAPLLKNAYLFDYNQNLYL
ncbi:MAG: dTDP-4-dehydrorhamnose 3,5-epimerase [Prevotellaceae bacterium]|jgi:dTDP-4-dehydrorhamnose 3,5-epimerase|nr:dTDP-4-dehydrorhamnose 3,5-epimerase [Prevotellaceae bacterium]